MTDDDDRANRSDWWDPATRRALSLVATTAAPEEDDAPASPPPPPPDTLGDGGRRFWEQITEHFEDDWRADEVRLLLEIANTIDLLDRMQVVIATDPLMIEGSTGQQRAHPLLAEVRQQRGALKALLSGLKFAAADFDPDGMPHGPMTRSESAKRAADARWAGKQQTPHGTYGIARGAA